MSSSIKYFIGFFLLIFSLSTTATPKITIKHKRSADNFAEIQITNDTTEKLLCYIAIDGYKIRFKLKSRQKSKWYKATDTRFNYQNFSVKCDITDK